MENTTLRVLHITEDFSRENTGVTSVVGQLASWQAKRGVDAAIYSTGKPVTDDLGVDVFWHDDFRFPASWRYPSGSESKLENIIRERGFDLLHLHGLWRAAPWMGQRIARRMKLPTILTVHGQVEPWAWHGQGRAKAWKKSLYWQLIGKKAFQDISFLHAITPLEKAHLLSLFPEKECVVIPNAIDLSFSRSDETRTEVPEQKFLFLGRIHPVKRIDWLINSFSRASLPKHWKLVIAGPEEDKTYARHLHGLVELLGIADRIQFVGPVYGAEKRQLLETSWAVVAPSFSEVIGMVNLEAAACHTPSITTFETGLLDWERGGGMLIPGHDDDALQQALSKASQWTNNERVARGSRSFQHVIGSYSMDVVGSEWLNVYTRLTRKR